MQKGITVRHEEDIVKLFMGLAAMNGTTGTDILRRSMEEYIEKNRSAGAEKLSGKTSTVPLTEKNPSQKKRTLMTLKEDN